MTDVKIFVTTHYCRKLPDFEPFHPILVGDFVDPLKWDIENDRTWDSIYQKNNLYSELTAHYWVWKNYDLPSYVGFFHYRRLLNFGVQVPYPPEKMAIMGDFFGDFQDFGTQSRERFGWRKDHIAAFCNRFDIILPTKQALFKKTRSDYTTVYDHYAFLNRIEDLEYAIQAIESLFPEYTSSSATIMRRPSAYLYNLYVMKRAVFIEYMNWLFAIFAFIEQKHEDSFNRFGKEPQPRVFGFLGERLINVFVEYQVSKRGLLAAELGLMFGKPCLPETDPVYF